MPCLNQDWLDALGILKRGVPTYIIPQVFNRVARIKYNTVLQKDLLQSTTPHAEFAVWYLPKHVEQAYKIERVEVHLALAHKIASEVMHLSVLEHLNLARKIGCSLSTSQDIRERWRLIDYETPLHLLPLAIFENRPTCKLCRGPVITGSGAWVKSGQDFDGPQLARGDEIEWWLGLSQEQQNYQIAEQGCLYLHYRHNVHEECMRYAHTVLVPIRKAQIELEKQKTTAEIDK